MKQQNDFELNYPAIPVLSTIFTRGVGFFGNAIRLVRGGPKAVNDLAFCNHAGTVTENRGQKNCTEETLDGLKPQSLEQYRVADNRIVSVLYWRGWDDAAKRAEALDYLAYICRKQGDVSTKVGKYDFKGVLSFLPIVGRYFKPDPDGEWCSENCASILKRAGAKFITKTELAPDQLYKIMKESGECEHVFNYYKYLEGV